MRKLRCVEFKSHGALTDFINTHYGISENDIQQIVVVNNTLILFYWE